MKFSNSRCDSTQTHCLKAPRRRDTHTKDHDTPSHTGLDWMHTSRRVCLHGKLPRTEATDTRTHTSDGRDDRTVGFFSHFLFRGHVVSGRLYAAKFSHFTHQGLVALDVAAVLGTVDEHLSASASYPARLDQIMFGHEHNTTGGAVDWDWGTPTGTSRPMVQRVTRRKFWSLEKGCS